jgi:hypothetical protein
VPKTFTDKKSVSGLWLVLGSLVIAAIFVVLLCWFFEPRWETNDDIAMSMAAHGYGIAAVSSPNLVFSNVLWGHLVRTIPEINGVLGYSSATLCELIIVGAVLIYGLYQLRVGYLACFAIFTLVMLRSVLFPQFTVNAGLLLVGAIICWQVYAKQNNWRILILGCLLAFLSYLVRSHEFLLVFIVALPLLPWRTLLLQQSAKIAFATLILAIACSMVIDNQAYQSDDWQDFNELNLPRAAFTDFGAGKHLKQRQELLHKYGYSTNDIDLVSGWFFVDTKIAKPATLKAMLAELGSLHAQDNAVVKGWAGIQKLLHPKILPLVFVALFLGVLRFNGQLAVSWGLFIAAVFTLGLLGRPGVLRVYVPLVCLLLIAPFLTDQKSTWPDRLGLSVLLVAALVNASHVFSESKALQISAEKTRKQLLNFPTDPVVVWGGVFPFESVYPVLGKVSSVMLYRLYGLGVFMLAPFSVSFEEQNKGRGMLDLLQTTGVPIIANDKRFGYLEIYCREHLHGQLKELARQQYGTFAVSYRQCKGFT